MAGLQSCGMGSIQRLPVDFLDGQRFWVIDGRNLNREDRVIEGSGEVLFQERLPSVSANAAFDLEFALAPEGSLDLNVFCGFRAQNCLMIRLSRSGESLGVAVERQGSELDRIVVTDQFTVARASAEVRLRFEIHQKPKERARILAWASPPYDDASRAIYDSDSDARVVPGKGGGGLLGSQAHPGAGSSGRSLESQYRLGFRSNDRRECLLVQRRLFVNMNLVIRKVLSELPRFQKIVSTDSGIELQMSRGEGLEVDLSSRLQGVPNLLDQPGPKKIDHQNHIELVLWNLVLRQVGVEVANADSLFTS
jgi:hypothetical protein